MRRILFRTAVLCAAVVLVPFMVPSASRAETCPPAGFYSPVAGTNVTVEFSSSGTCSNEPEMIHPLCGKGTGECVKMVIKVRIRNGDSCDFTRYRCGDASNDVTVTCGDHTVEISTLAGSDWGDQLTGCAINVCEGGNCDDGSQ